MEFLGQESDPSHCNLCHSCGNAASLTHCAGAGVEPMSQCCRDTTNPVVPWQGFPHCFYFYVIFSLWQVRLSTYSCAISCLLYLFIYIYIFCFLGQHLQHMEVPRLGVESELQLPACATATATGDPSRVCNLHHRSWKHQILNLLSEARNRTHILMDTSRVCNLLSHDRNVLNLF